MCVHTSPMLLLALALAAAGCGGGVQYVVDSPPAFSAERALWWAHKIDNADPDYLAFLLELSEAHRRLGTSANYRQFSMGRTMIAMFYFESYLPMPLPYSATEAIKERLVGHTVSEQCPAGLPGFWMEDEPSMAIWHETLKKFGWEKQTNEN